MLKYCLSGFPHSEIHGYSGYLLLPVAYRSLSRPSSAPDAKAFPLRSFQLDLSNHLLILKVELCRQFNRIFEIVIVTHLYDVPQLKLKIRSFKLSFKRPLCCLAYHFFITLFSFQGSIFQLLLQPDLKICLYARSSNPTTTVVSVSRPPDEIRLYLALHARCNLLVGPSGLEPPTLRLSVVRSSQLSYGPVVDTCSISLAALHAVRLAHFAASPLPRRPASLGSARILDVLAIISLVEIVGIEPATSCLQGRRSPS